MYEDFYNLKEKPFNLTPSPRFLYLSEGHKEALALLKYGVIERQGFILLTGEVGTGKTTMVRALLDSLDSNIKYVLLSNPLLSPKDFINYVAFSTFKNQVHFKSKAHFLLVFEAYLRKAVKDQKNFNLIIDEAHRLSFKLLEEIRLLSNLETGDQKLINIFLVGQPELNQKLSDPRCRPLLQRISIRHHIPPLNLEETRDYMETRLKVAGAKKAEAIFSKSAIEAIHICSNGYPREINVLADNALLLGYSKGTKKITPTMVKTCHVDLKLDVPSKLKKVHQKAEPPKTGKIVSLSPKRHWKWVVVLFFIMVIPAFASTQHGKNIISKLTAIMPKALSPVEGPQVLSSVEGPKVLSSVEGPQVLSPVEGPQVYQAGTGVVPQKGTAVGERTDTNLSKAPEIKAMGIKDSPQISPAEKEKLSNPVNPLPRLSKQSGLVRQLSGGLVRQLSGGDPVHGAPPAQLNPKHVQPGLNARPVKREASLTGVKPIQPGPERSEFHRGVKTLIVKNGDTLSKLVFRIYRRYDEKIFTMVKKANPHIENINIIKPNEKIVFPHLPPSDQLSANSSQP